MACRFARGIVLAASLLLSACGTDPGERAVTGGLLGAGTGAAIGSVTGSAGAGAVIGGVAGAAIGAASAPCKSQGSQQHCSRPAR